MIYSWDHLLLKSHWNLYLNPSHLTNSVNKNNSPAGPVFYTSAVSVVVCSSTSAVEDCKHEARNRLDESFKRDALPLLYSCHVQGLTGQI